MRYLLPFLLLTPLLTAATMVNGVPVPDDVMAVARQAVAGNSPRDALLRPDSIFRDHPMFQQLFNRLDFNKINEEAAKMMVETFTKDEMSALVRFQNSPEGRAIITKMPGYQQLVGAMVQNELKAAMEAYVLSQQKAGIQTNGMGAQSPGVGIPTGIPAANPATNPYGLPPGVPSAAPAIPTQPAPAGLQGTGGSPISH